MKLNKFFSALMLIVAAMFAACTNPVPPVPPTPGTDTTTVEPLTPVDTLTCAEAVQLSEGTEIAVIGYVTYAFPTSKGEQSAWLADDKTASSGIIEAYYLTITDSVKKGDKVVARGTIKYYTNKSGDQVVELIKPGTMTILEADDGSGEIITDATDVTVAEAIAKAQEGDNGYFRVTATVLEVKTAAANVPSKYTNINMTVKDETGKIDCFFTNYLENKAFTSADQIPPVGTKLKVVGKVTMYQGTTPEFINGYIEEIIEVGDGGGEIIADAEEITVAEAIRKAQAGDKGNYKLTGLVYSYSTDLTKVPGTYTNVDFTLKDETGSITCYRTNYIDNKPFSDASQIPPVGSKLTVVGPLTMYQTTPEVDHGYITEVIEVGDGNVPINPDDFEGDGTQDNPYTIADVILLNNAVEGPFYVKGFIVGSADGSLNKAVFAAEGAVASNILIADDASETDTKKVVPVQLSSGSDARKALNLVDNKGNLGKEVLLHGKLQKYFSVAGVKELDGFTLIETEEEETEE